MTRLISVRSLRERVERQPNLLVHQGRVLTDDAPLEVSATSNSTRRHGLASVEEAEAVVLDSNGDVSIIARTEGRDDAPVVRDVRRP